MTTRDVVRLDYSLAPKLIEPPGMPAPVSASSTEHEGGEEQGGADAAQDYSLRASARDSISMTFEAFSTIRG